MGISGNKVIDYWMRDAKYDLQYQGYLWKGFFISEDFCRTFDDKLVLKKILKDFIKEAESAT